MGEQPSGSDPERDRADQPDPKLSFDQVFEEFKRLADRRLPQTEGTVKFEAIAAQFEAAAHDADVFEGLMNQITEDSELYTSPTSLFLTQEVKNQIFQYWPLLSSLTEEHEDYDQVLHRLSELKIERAFLLDQMKRWIERGQKA